MRKLLDEGKLLLVAIPVLLWTLLPIYHLFVLSIFAWALTGFANVYYGLGRRVLDLTLESLAKRTSIAVSTSMALRHTAACEELISPKYRTWRCTTRPPATRLFSTTLQ